MILALTDCPACGLPADILDVQTFASTSGPVELTRTRCVDGHVLDTAADAQAVD